MDTTAKSSLTPLMQQYQSIKNQYRDTILLFRLGDFYEMFFDDAKKASQILEIALTSRHGSPMCGVPYHSVNNYIAKLIKAGIKVAICDQTEDPAEAKGLVKRDVVRVITAGTVLEDNLLDPKTNNYLLAFFPEKDYKSYGVVFVDTSTGELTGTQVQNDPYYQKLNLEISRFAPNEAIIPRGGNENSKVINIFQNNNVPTNFYFHGDINVSTGVDTLSRLGMQPQALKGNGIEDKPLFIQAVAAAVGYLEKTQLKFPEYIKNISTYSLADHLVLDETVVRNLGIISNNFDGNRKGSMLDVIDQTLTAMGGRLIRTWLLFPLKDIGVIKSRQRVVKEFVEDNITRKNCRDVLSSISDLERLVSRVFSGIASPRDVVNLKSSLAKVPELRSVLAGITVVPQLVSEQQQRNSEGYSAVIEIVDKIKELPEVVSLIHSAIVDEPPADLTSGRVIRKGYSQQLDELKSLSTGGKQWVAELEAKERNKTGINNLKIGYTGVFGYYIEVTKSNLESVPQEYIRKQTLVNSERFITPELKEKEAMILGAEERIVQLEQQLFKQVRTELLKFIDEIQLLARTIAQIDCYQSLASLAVANRYVLPEVNDSYVLDIRDGRHPVIETMLPAKFVPNDTVMDNIENQLFIITGPNMAGKSTYIRQTALITILAQMGSYVPAKSAVIGIVDRIFTRIGSGENIVSGESTFMVEMHETANIMHNCTSRSLLILDEIGRGTSTFDGISIAWACVEYLAKPAGPRTLFATHYFELTELAGKYKCVKNYNVSVREWGDEIVFLHKIVAGSADKSYGIHVAKLAGLPGVIVKRAKEIIYALEQNSAVSSASKALAGTGELGLQDTQNENVAQLDLFPLEYLSVIAEIRKLDPNTVTPIEALNLLIALKEKLK
ncbi:MAG: DNA mismatch repair protein MutS [Elusimicrobiota bacterium]